MTSLYIFGAGGSGREVAWLASETLDEGARPTFLVGDEKYVTGPVNGLEVRHVSDAIAGKPVVIAIGDSAVRRAAATVCDEIGLVPTTLVHPGVQMSQRVAIDAGSIVCAGSILTTEVTLGRHVHINVGCTVGHDVHIGDFVTISPGAHISGWVTIEENAFIGTGSTIVNGAPGKPLVIGAGAVIAAGACVLASVPRGALMAGVPAVRKR